MALTRLRAQAGTGRRVSIYFRTRGGGMRSGTGARLPKLRGPFVRGGGVCRSRGGIVGPLRPNGFFAMTVLRYAAIR